MSYADDNLGGDLMDGQPLDDLLLSQQQEPAQPEQQKPITLADLEAFGQKLERRLQSMTDKQEHRIKKEVDGKLAKLDAYYNMLGQSMPADVRQQVINETILSQLESEGVDAPSVPSPEEVRVAVSMRNRLNKTYGVGPITEQDPEWSLIKWEARTFDEHIDSYETAARTKAIRIRGAKEPSAPASPEARPSVPASRAPALGNAPAAGDKQSQLRAQYDAEKKLAKSTDEVINIRAKYRGMGLDI